MKKVFFALGIGFAAFAAAMLMNFITVGISYRKREIGILRAVGARGKDVFKIFFFESAMIAVINWILASLATEYVVNAINKMLKINYKLGITVLHFGIVQIILMFVLSLSVAWLASFIPVNNVSRKKPIEAIRKN